MSLTAAQVRHTPGASKAADVAVLGAAGFVGKALLRSLEEMGQRVTAVVRGVPEMAADGAFHRVALASDDIGKFDVVINLAYPTSGHVSTHLAATEAIVDRTLRLLKVGGHVIHVSTLAVFGSALERDVHPGAAPYVRDTAYVEAKLAAERLLLGSHKRGEFSLDIVRLGNVVGPASPAWATGTVQRLITGRPVAVSGAPGWSNSTDVLNAASYLAFLSANATRPDDPRFHHVAEFYDIPWSVIIEPLANELGVDVQSASPDSIGAPDGLWRELGSALSGSAPRSLYRTLSSERVAGSWLRSALRRLPPSAFERLKGPTRLGAASTPQAPGEDQPFLSVMAGYRQFPLTVLDGWSPPISLDESIDATLVWLRRN